MGKEIAINNPSRGWAGAWKYDGCFLVTNEHQCTKKILECALRVFFSQKWSSMSHKNLSIKYYKLLNIIIQTAFLVKNVHQWAKNFRK